MQCILGNIALQTILRISQDRNGPETMELFGSTSINSYYLSKCIYRIGPCLLGLHEKAVNVCGKSRSTSNKAS